METIRQEVGILFRHGGAAGAVDNHRIKQMVFFHQADKPAQIERLLRLSQFLLPGFQ